MDKEAPKFQLLETDLLHVDLSYQREPTPSRARKIAREMDETLFGCLSVNIRKSGKPFVWDGWHRKLAADELAWKTVPCLVSVGMTRTEEAEAYYRANTGQKKPSALETFKARVVAKEPIALKMRDLCIQAGYRINGSGEAKSIGAIVSLEKVLRRGGPDVFLWTLHQHHLWTPDAQPQGATLTGLGFFKATLGIVDESRLQKRVFGYPVQTVLRKSREMAAFESGSASRPLLVAAAIADLYSGKRGKLRAMVMGKFSQQLAVPEESPKGLFGHNAL